MKQPKPLIFKQPAKTCPVCKKTHQSKYRCCSWECEREYQRQQAALEAADREKHEEPF